ncbi:INO80 complex subunit E isoform X2 [Cryptotermes secundus]|uniref:INO80 complex subunit E isoform X2 n=1 Tax=Cryptotermes secundus TaxID=105785 RepID=UPI001454C335|nr:INO80 complex subunit E isoform X2 [Cryptotermes secundus]
MEKENECFQEDLRSTQRRLLKASRDRSFLLDRLLQYEKVDVSSSESEETESSDEGETSRPDTAKRKKPDSGVNSHVTITQPSGSTPKMQSSIKKKRPPPKATKQNSVPPLQVVGSVPVSLLSDGHMTPEEVERHLESRQTYLELVPEKAPPTVPTEMFSNDPSLDSESNEVCELETSPSNMGEDCLSVDMIPE